MTATLITFVFFAGLAVLTLAVRSARAESLSRSGDDWLVDGAGLFVQGVAVPALQIIFVGALGAVLLPGLRGAWHIPAEAAFLLNFVAIDYAYYWNHRLLHTAALWPAHELHHASPRLDVFVTSRNTLWAPLLIIYMWINGLITYLLADPAPFLAAAALGAGLDLWRHTAFGPAPGSWVHRALGAVFITPHEHAWHHSAETPGVNFGANFSLWDRIHGTLHSPRHAPSRIGSDASAPALSLFLNPYARKPLKERASP